MKFTGPNKEHFEVLNITKFNQGSLLEKRENQLFILWFDSDSEASTMEVDTHSYSFGKNDMVFLTEFHQLNKLNIDQAKLLRFNRPFYCILDHDSEVGCKGVLYYGSSTLPIVSPEDEDLDILNTVWKMICIELDSTDNLQLEMLQMMLKRLLILCTRMYKKQENYTAVSSPKNEIIRAFNYLVESHFKEKHTVGEYAQLLHKSPKTLSNLFKKIGDKTPLQFIQNRILLESHRLLRYTDKAISDIAYELGFNDVQAFSRFFKSKEGLSPLDFRKSSN